jgi:O-antigen/teichoic acid export membrane protein
LVQTGTLTAAAAITVALALLYPLVQVVLGLVIEDPALLPQAVAIVPYALGSLWLSATASVVYASIDGFQRVDLRNIILMGGAGVFLASALWLVPSRGLIGLAQAQVLQGATVLTVSWLVLRRLLPELPVLPLRWSRPAFREMIGYSLRFQGIAFTLLLFEPLTKSLLARFGSVSSAGYFEMANRLAMQLRAFIVTAHTSLVPTITDISEKAPELLRGVYEASCRIVAFLLLVLLPLLIALTPLISVVWLGSFEPLFVLFATLVFIGWFGNLVGNPGYIGYMGEGRIRWNLRSHLLTGVVNVALGIALGALAGGVGVVVAFVVALLSGSLLVAVAYSREHGYRMSIWAAPDNLLLGAASVAGMGAVLLLYYRFAESLGVPLLVVASLAVYALIAGVPLWLHSARRQMHAWAMQVFASTSAGEA